MVRKLRYSERKRLAEEGTLGDLDDDAPDTLRIALTSLMNRAPQYARGKFHSEMNTKSVEFFGRTGNWQSVVKSAPTDEFLDFLEIASEEAQLNHSLPRRGSTAQIVERYPFFDHLVNELMERHRFGYRLDGGEVRKIGSPALDIEVTGPTLLAVKRTGWEEAEKSFREALDHQRAGEVDDALTAANAAVEAALKAAGFKGRSLGPLAKDFKKSTTVPSYLAGVPELIEQLLGKLMAARSQHGDAHGKAPGSAEAEQALADLAVYWAGAFISYLADVMP